MIVQDFAETSDEGLRRVSARVRWEEADRADMEIFYEVPSELRREPEPPTESFALATFLAAWRHGERRLRLEGELCPVLREGLDLAMAWLGEWYRKPDPPLTIEADSRQRERPRGDRTAALLSGGIDSLATLAANRKAIPATHAARVRDAIVVYGFDMAGVRDHDPDVENRAFEDVVAGLRAVVESDPLLTLVPIRTNLKHLDDNWSFWRFELLAAALASAAHLLSDRVSTALISSACPISPAMRPTGSHPQLDHNYSSDRLRIMHYGHHLTRLEKVALVAGWKEALENVRVCEDSRAGRLNCGTCEKCVRTKLAFEALGVRDEAATFEHGECVPEDLEGLKISTPYNALCYRELQEPLRSRGRDDLANAIGEALDGYRRHARLGLTADEGYRLEEFDRRQLRGRIKRFARQIAGLTVHKLRKTWIRWKRT